MCFSGPSTSIGSCNNVEKYTKSKKDRMGKKRRQERLFWHSFCKTNKRRQLALLLVIFVIGAVDVDRKTFPVCYEMGRREGKAAQEKDFPFFIFFFLAACSVSHPSYYEYLRVCFHFYVALRCMFGKETRINGFFSHVPMSGFLR